MVAERVLKSERGAELKRGEEEYERGEEECG